VCFLGYVANYKRYRCLDSILGQVYVSHHVWFHENQYPFPHLASQSPQVPHCYVFSLIDVLCLTPVIPPSVPDPSRPIVAVAAGLSSASGPGPAATMSDPLCGPCSLSGYNSPTIQA